VPTILSFFSVFSTLPIILASIGLVLATSSFISGLQLVKGANVSERKIHRFNGFATIILYLVLAVFYFRTNGIGVWGVLAWLIGFFVIFLKLSIVHAKNRRRAFKYVSWLGGTLIVIWLILVYINIPI
jgi:hypothetical protein